MMEKIILGVGGTIILGGCVAIVTLQRGITKNSTNWANLRQAEHDALVVKSQGEATV